MKGKKLKRDDNTSNIKKRYAEVDTKLVIILVIVGIFAILIGISQLSNTNEDKNNIQRTIQTTTTLSRPLTCEESCRGDLTCINNCKSAEVNRIATKEDATFKDCDNIKDKNIKQECIDNIAIKQSTINLDDSYCNYIENNIKKGNCKNNVLLSKALKNKDVTLCDKITLQITRDLCKESLK